MTNRSGFPSPSPKRSGQPLMAEDINRIVQGLLRQLVGGKGIRIHSFGDRIVIDKTDSNQRLPTAKSIILDTSDFDGILSEDEDTVQKAMDVIDDVDADSIPVGSSSYSGFLGEKEEESDVEKVEDALVRLDEIEASEIPTDTSNFDNNLSENDDTIQKALDTIDDLSIGGDAVWEDVYEAGPHGAPHGRSVGDLLGWNGTSWDSRTDSDYDTMDFERVGVIIKDISNHYYRVLWRGYGDLDESPDWAGTNQRLCIENGELTDSPSSSQARVFGMQFDDASKILVLPNALDQGVSYYDYSSSDFGYTTFRLNRLGFMSCNVVTTASVQIGNYYYYVSTNMTAVVYKNGSDYILIYSGTKSIVCKDYPSSGKYITRNTSFSKGRPGLTLTSSYQTCPGTKCEVRDYSNYYTYSTLGYAQFEAKIVTTSGGRAYVRFDTDTDGLATSAKPDGVQTSFEIPY